MRIRRVCLFSILCLAFLDAAPSNLFAQGPITPSGTPGPTMKTLDQVQPRSDIQKLTGDGANQFIISQSGSYYLTANVTGASGKNGISVQADNVTVDLNGFGLIGAGGSLSGLAVSGAHKNIAIFNGSAQGWGGSGIDAGNASNAQLNHLRLASNGAAGLVVGSGSIARDCVALSNTGDGIRVIGTASRIEDNNSTSNTGAGIKVDGPGNLVIKNNATSNTAADYDIATGSSYGQVVMTPGANFTTSTAWANFSSSCPAGQVFCSGVCSNLGNNPSNCGTCGNVCNLANASVGCAGGNCTIVTCNTGFANCDSQTANGCEVNTTNDASHCGNCGTVCSTAANGTPGCANSTCVVAACNSGFADCDAVYTNGCEVNTNTDVSNCGSCGHACALNNAIASCTAASCTISSCNTGFANCNAQAADGCEINTTNDFNNCGSCGHVCTKTANVATSACSSSACIVASCNSGFANCNSQYTDGCEINTTNDFNNCGSCGHVCTKTANVATSACSSSACIVASCNSGFANCNGQYADGCEINTTNDANNCGSCGHTCGLGHSCIASVCN